MHLCPFIASTRGTHPFSRSNAVLVCAYVQIQGFIPEEDPSRSPAQTDDGLKPPLLATVQFILAGVNERMRWEIANWGIAPPGRAAPCGGDAKDRVFVRKLIL